VSDQPTQEQRLAALAEELCHAYHYGVGLTELEQEDPEQAAAHRQAAVFLLQYLERAPREEKKSAFQRGYDRGRENQKKSTAEQMQHLEQTVAELRTERDPEGLRARIADLTYVNRGWERLMHGTTAGRTETADLLRRLEAAQRELAELKGAQPSNATGKRPS
jgi:hypothetical protein